MQDWRQTSLNKQKGNKCLNHNLHRSSQALWFIRRLLLVRSCQKTMPTGSKNEKALVNKMILTTNLKAKLCHNHDPSDPWLCPIGFSSQCSYLRDRELTMAGDWVVVTLAHSTTCRQDSCGSIRTGPLPNATEWSWQLFCIRSEVISSTNLYPATMIFLAWVHLNSP